MLKGKLITSVKDDRGLLSVLLSNSELDRENNTFGQIYVVTFDDKNVVRGNHYHKNWHEWVWVLYGSIEFIFEDVVTGKREQRIIEFDGKKQSRIELPPYVAHSFRSVSDFAILLSYANTEWDPEDSYFHKLS